MNFRSTFPLLILSAAVLVGSLARSAVRPVTPTRETETEVAREDGAVVDAQLARERVYLSLTSFAPNLGKLVNRADLKLSSRQVAEAIDQADRFRLPGGVMGQISQREQDGGRTLQVFLEEVPESFIETKSSAKLDVLAAGLVEAVIRRLKVDPDITRVRFVVNRIKDHSLIDYLSLLGFRFATIGIDWGRNRLGGFYFGLIRSYRLDLALD